MNTAFDEYSKLISPTNVPICMAPVKPGTTDIYINLHIFNSATPNDNDVCQCGKFFYTSVKRISSQ